jgi:hypothetical protein
VSVKSVTLKRSDWRTGEAGQILILTALSMTMLLGIAALSIDASFMYDKRNHLHAAADAAAKSAAIEVQRNPSVSLADLQTFANQQVIAHGFDPSGATSVVVNHGPASGPFAGLPGYVEVIVSEPTATFFGVILGLTSMTPGARAVAGTGNNLACFMTLGPPGSSPYSLSLGNTQLTMNGCGVAVGGDVNGANPNASITGTPLPSVGVVGTCTGTCTGMGALSTGASAPTDPLAGLAAPPQTGLNCPAGIAGTAATLLPGCYTSIASTVTTLQPGIYYVTGTVDIGHLSGTNVMIYLTGAGQLTSSNNQDLTLTAPTSGPYAGIAIFQDPTDTNNFLTGNNFTLSVSGAIYMPGVDVDIANALTFTATNCTLFIAKTLSIRNGNGAISNSGCAATYGGAAFLSVSIAE